MEDAGIFKGKDLKAIEKEAGVALNSRTYAQYNQVPGCESHHHHDINQP